MSSPDWQKQKTITFPRVWEYRLFFRASETDAVTEKIMQAAQEAGVKAEVVPGPLSAGGSYRAFHVSGTVDSRETAERLGKALRAVPELKFLL